MKPSQVNKEVNKGIKKYIENENEKIENTIYKKAEYLIQNISKLISDIQNDRVELDSVIQMKRMDVFAKKSEIEEANENINRDCVSTCDKSKGC